MAKAAGGSTVGNGKRVAIVDGLRTPFAKQGTAYAKMSALDLGATVVRELLERTSLPAAEVERVVYGQVVPSLSGPNIAREIVLDTGMRRDVDAYSVSRACATSYQSAVDIAQAIWSGDIDCGVAGGADSASDVPIAVSRPLAEALIKMNKARTLADRVKAFKTLKPRDLIPVPPALKERSTGLTMGESAEKMARENGISRGAQDEYAHRSHSLAAKAWEDGRFGQEVMAVHVTPKYDETIAEDNTVRRDSSIEGYAKLRPVFDKRYGTITAGNSSPLTDGASALLMMSEDKAKALGYKPLGYLRSFAFTALDPAGQMLMGPAYATPIALERAGVQLSDMALVDLHEAFAAQVLSVTQAFESKAFAEKELGRSTPIGKVEWDKFNVSGGSISIGHPFAATGARQITQVLRELGRRGGGLGLCSACAAGGLGAAMVLEVE
jgi:acetyl-CoA acyltransferase